MTVQELINLLQKVENKQSNITVTRQHHYGEKKRNLCYSKRLRGREYDYSL